VSFILPGFNTALVLVSLWLHTKTALHARQGQLHG